MCSPSASAARAPSSTARQFSTGSAPGKPRHTGHVFELGASPKCVEQPQKIFDAVFSCAWTSRPMMVSQALIVSSFKFRVLGSPFMQSKRFKSGEAKNLNTGFDLKLGT